MKSLRARLTVWFASGLMLVLVAFVVFTYRVLDTELHRKNWRLDYPDHPDWNLHGSYSEAEIKDILGELVETALLYGVPLAVVALLIGYWLARKSVQPIADVNRQLQAIRAPKLARRIHSPELDNEFRDLVGHINDLLVRLQRSFNDMSEYSAKVAHELRTPLAILRLKLEQAGPRIAPELAEEIQAELHQLSHVVDQSLLIAKAEQGRLMVHPRRFDLAGVVADIAHDFALLAQEEDRVVRLEPLRTSEVIADPHHVRQIVQNLFTNALKHGQGEIRVRLRHQDGTRRLSIVNRVRGPRPASTETLGLGLRVVDTLLGLERNLRCHRHQTLSVYAVRLAFPAAPPDSVASGSTLPAWTVNDPGI